MGLGLVAGWSCAVCGEHVDIAEPLVWRCPNATDDDRHHALQIVQSIAPLRGGDDVNPFVAFQRYLAWDSFAAANGMTESARVAMIANVDAAIAECRWSRSAHHAVRPRRRAVRRLGLRRRWGRVGEGRDRPGRRKPQAATSRDHLVACSLRGVVALGDVERRCRSSAAGHRLVWQRRVRRRAFSRRRPIGRCECSFHLTPTLRC